MTSMTENRRSDPASSTDTAPCLALPDLVRRGSATEGTSVWTTSSRRKAAYLLMAAVVAVPAAAGFGALPAGLGRAWIPSVISWGLWLGCLATVAVLCGIALRRGQLVVDSMHRTVEIRRSRWSSSNVTLSADEIRELRVDGMPVGAPDWAYQPDVLAARLRNGTIVSLAIDAPDDLRQELQALLPVPSASLFPESLSLAIEPARVPTH